MRQEGAQCRLPTLPQEGQMATPGVRSPGWSPSQGPGGFQPDPFPSLTLAACLVSEQSRRLGET